MKPNQRSKLLSNHTKMIEVAPIFLLISPFLVGMGQTGNVATRSWFNGTRCPNRVIQIQPRPCRQLHPILQNIYQQTLLIQTRISRGSSFYMFGFRFPTKKKKKKEYLIVSFQLNINLFFCIKKVKK